jgi:hypothetical protein
MRLNTLIFCLTVMLFAGCAHTEVWEKTGGNQQVFDIDSRECEYIAEQVSLLHSETGKKGDPAHFSKAYTECLNSKGWSRKVVVPGSAKVPAPGTTVKQLAELVNSNGIQGFGQTVTVPDTYKLLKNKQFQSGPTIIKQFFWKGDDSSFINVLFQENVSTTFEQLPYPVSEPYRLYTFGEGKKAGERLQWAAFYGNIGSNWVMGTGAYYYVSKNERIIVVITKSLAHPSGTAPQRVSLTRNQFLEVEQFSKQWQLWLNKQFQQGPGAMKQFIEALKFGK